jgi:hypothetical protein
MSRSAAAVEHQAPGKPLFFWVQAFWLLIVALLATAITSSRSTSQDYVVLHKWFRVFIRFALAAAMLEYEKGLKVIPRSFLRRRSTRWSHRRGHDAKRPAVDHDRRSACPEIFTGCIEVLGGILLLMPGRRCWARSLVWRQSQVAALNMTISV